MITIKNIGYTDDGKVFFQLFTTYKEEPIATMVQFEPDNADGFAKEIMKAATMARSKGVTQ